MVVKKKKNGPIFLEARSPALLLHLQGQIQAMTRERRAKQKPEGQTLNPTEILCCAYDQDGSLSAPLHHPPGFFRATVAS